MKKSNKFSLPNRYKLLIINLDLLIKNGILSLIQKILFFQFRTQEPKKILIYRIGSIGDNVCALPAIAAIRDHYPQAQIHILTHSGEYDYGSMEKIIREDVVDKIWNYKNIPLRELTRQLRKNKYDLFIELPKVTASLSSTLRNIFFAKAIGARDAWGWEIYVTKIFKKEFNNRNLEREPDRLIRIIGNKNIKITQKKYPFNIKEEDKQYIEGFLSERNLNDKSRNIIIVPGAKYAKKRWPLAYFKYVILALTELGFNIFIIGGENDIDTSANLHSNTNIYDLRGKLNLMQTAYIFRFCRLVITNDTGPMHLADAMEVPLIAIFNSSDYREIWYPLKDRSAIFRNEEVGCKLCFHKPCPDNICMKEIDPAKVMEGVHSKLLNNR